jgi:uncharacterized protein with HEPN domain
MPLEARDAAFLWDMREAARTTLQFIANESLQSFVASALLQAAVERQLILVGEAARRVSQAGKAMHPEVPWREIVAQRNILIHEYGEIAPDLVWRTATEDLPRLLEQLEALVPPVDDNT